MYLKTQINSWIDLQNVIKGKRKEIYHMLRSRPMTLFELKNCLNWEINSISGRVTELARLGLIEACGTRINPKSGKQGTVWQAKQLELF